VYYETQRDYARKLEKDALSNERKRLQAILDSAYEATITIDEKRIIESCDQRVADMLGHSNDFLTRKNVSVWKSFRSTSQSQRETSATRDCSLACFKTFQKSWQRTKSSGTYKPSRIVTCLY